MTRVWSQHQEKIFSFVTMGRGNGIVEAVAGSGKTTTMVEAQKRIQTRTNIFLAFNKSIAEELKLRGVNARTFHSLTYSAVTRHKGTRNIEEDKLYKIIKNRVTGDEVVMYGTFISRLVSLGKQVGLDCLIPATEQAWLAIVQYHDLELENEKATLSRAIELADQLLRWSNESEMVDFDDLLYVAVREGLTLQKFDFVFVDEAQDTNAIQRALLRKIMNPHSRMIAVGDPAQAIYGFRGADGNSMGILANEFDCSHLPLTISYRCPVKVVEYARRWVKHIEFAPNAPDGAVNDIGEKWEFDLFQANDLVVCRTTKPLITMAFRMMKNRVPVFIMGREIGENLKRLINKLNAPNLEALQPLIDIWARREIEKAIAKQQDSKVETIQDKADALLYLIDGLEPHESTIAGLLHVLTKLFSNVKDAVCLATIHKSKGLEAKRVFWLNSSQCPSKFAKQCWQKQQERNLCYVATTRAMEELFLIEEPTHRED